MTNASGEVAGEIAGRGSDLLVEESATLVARRRTHRGAGVARGALDAYAIARTSVVPDDDRR